MQKTILKVVNEVGLHARPASEFVKLAAQFKASILVRNVTAGSQPVDAKSILSVLTLGVEQGHQIEISCEGEDEQQALEALQALVAADFNGKP